MESHSKSLDDIIPLLDKLIRREIQKTDFLKNLTNLEDEYDLKNDVTHISRGGQAEVLKVKRKVPNGKFYALKKYLYSLDSMQKGELEQVYREIDNLRRLDHPNVAKIFAVGKIEDKYPCIILNLCDGTLNDFIDDFTNRNVAIPEDSIREITLSIAQSLLYIHGEKIVHRDLKPHNILYVSQNGKRNWKIIDFGSSHLQSQQNTTTVKSAMTIVYACIEQIEENAAVPAFDVWALGTILYQLMARKLPYQAKNQKQLIEEIKTSTRQPLPAVYSQDLRDLVDRMLTILSAQRIQLVEVVYWLKMLNQNQSPVTLRLQFVERELYQLDNYYTGYLMQGQRFGYGQMEFGKGLIYEGEWRDDLRNGKGNNTWLDGSTYEGQFKDDLRHGKGSSVAQNKETHEGLWVKGKKDGHGIHSWPDSSKYTGDFKEDQLHGKGTMVYANGDTFSGDWSHGKKAGKGKYTWTDGVIYEGEYKDDRKHGKGKMTYPDKSYYEGKWENDARHGEGVQKEDGEAQKGMWKDGEFQKFL